MRKLATLYNAVCLPHAYTGNNYLYGWISKGKPGAGRIRSDINCRKIQKRNFGRIPVDYQ